MAAPFGQEGLVATWVGPVPGQAKVTIADGSVFSAVAQVMGPEIHKELPEKYTSRLDRVELFNASMHWEFDELVQWEERHGTGQIREEPWQSLFRDYYLARGYAILGVLAKHPIVSDVERFSACSVINQRGVIVYDGVTEHLFLRSYFHSKGSAGGFVNFVPRGGIKMSFASDCVWFPLALTSAQLRVNPEPASYVVLDILTLEPFSHAELPNPFQAVQPEAGISEIPGQLELWGRNYHVTRIVGKLSSTEDRDDFILTI